MIIVIVWSLWWWSLSPTNSKIWKLKTEINCSQMPLQLRHQSWVWVLGEGGPFSRAPASLQPILGRFVTRAETKEALPTILTEILHSEVVWLWPRIWNQSWWRGDSRKIARVSQLSHCPTKLGGTIGHLVAVGGAVGHQVGDQTRWCSGQCGHLLGASA